MVLSRRSAGGNVPPAAGAAAAAVAVFAGSVAAGVVEVVAGVVAVSVGLAAASAGFFSFVFLKAAFSLAFKLLSALGAVSATRGACQR